MNCIRAYNKTMLKSKDFEGGCTSDTTINCIFLVNVRTLKNLL